MADNEMMRPNGLNMTPRFLEQVKLSDTGNPPFDVYIEGPITQVNRSAFGTRFREEAKKVINATGYSRLVLLSFSEFPALVWSPDNSDPLVGLGIQQELGFLPGTNDRYHAQIVSTVSIEWIHLMFATIAS